MASNVGLNKYSHTPRRVFEKAIERQQIVLSRLKVEVRALESRLNARAHSYSELKNLLDDLEYQVRIELNRSRSTGEP